MSILSIQKLHYAITPEGDHVEQYVLSNRTGMSVSIITFGGIVTNLTAPDRNGKYQDVVLGYANPQDYFKESSEYFGALIGRVANRIAGGKFSLDHVNYQIGVNNGPNALHGGAVGFDRKMWSAQIDETAAYPTLMLTCTSKDKEEGFPGTLKVKVTYALTHDNTFEITYEAETDKKTVVNLTHHSYFNLSANFSNTILDHELSLEANEMLPISKTLIPTGEVQSVQGTPFDFRSAKAIGKDINALNEQLDIAKGYDHCWILHNAKGFKQVGTVFHPSTGRVMTVSTDQPAVQLYSGNFLDGTKPSKTGGMYEKQSGFCLETQQYPDAPNQPAFPSIELSLGALYLTKTAYKFSTK